MKKERPWVIAHRGAREEAPENTGSALRRAAELPIQGVEFDVQMSSDGVPVLFHDRTLFKINRRRSRVANCTFDELQRYDWGGWFGRAFANEPLTTLDGALSILKGCPNICIEIKSHPGDRESGHINRLTGKVVDVLNRPEMHAIKNRALILSFDAHVLSRVHQLDEELRCVLNLPENAPLTPEPDTRYLWAVDVRIGKLTEGLVQWAHNRKLRVFTYTCNGPRQVNKAVRAGVDAIISDRPAWLIQHLERG